MPLDTVFPIDEPGEELLFTISFVTLLTVTVIVFPVIPDRKDFTDANSDFACVVLAFTSKFLSLMLFFLTSSIFLFASAVSTSTFAGISIVPSRSPAFISSMDISCMPRATFISGDIFSISATQLLISVCNPEVSTPTFP